MLRRNGDEKVGQPFCEARLRHHLDDSAIQRILDQHARNRRNRGANSVYEKPRPPMKQQAGDQEQKDVVVQFENDTETLVPDFSNHVCESEETNQYRENWAVFEPLAWFFRFAGGSDHRFIMSAHSLDATSESIYRVRIECNRHRYRNQNGRDRKALP